MAPQDPPQADWRAFVLTHGWRAAGHELAAVLGVPQEAVEALRRTGACTRREQAHDFPALFALWHGRPPADEDWPAPRKACPASTPKATRCGPKCSCRPCKPWWARCR